MKKHILLFLCLLGLLCIAIILYRYRNGSSTPIDRPDVPRLTQSTIAPSVPTVQYNGATYAYDILPVTNPNRISLIPNFTGKKDSQTLKTQNSCTHAVNGGFYDTENRPLGLFQTNGSVIRKNVTNRLINGYIWANESKTMISEQMPEDSARFTLQTGPLLILHGDPLPLTIKNDEPARRIVAMRSTQGTLYFMALYQTDSVFQGPLLEELPLIVSLIDKKEQLDLDASVNLDGGSASAFYGSVALSELSPVGSMFCIK